MNAHSTPAANKVARHKNTPRAPPEAARNADRAVYYVCVRAQLLHFSTKLEKWSHEKEE